MDSVQFDDRIPLVVLTAASLQELRRTVHQIERRDQVVLAVEQLAIGPRILLQRFVDAAVRQERKVRRPHLRVVRLADEDRTTMGQVPEHVHMHIGVAATRAFRCGRNGICAGLHDRLDDAAGSGG